MAGQKFYIKYRSENGGLSKSIITEEFRDEAHALELMKRRGWSIEHIALADDALLQKLDEDEGVLKERIGRIPSVGWSRDDPAVKDLLILLRSQNRLDLAPPEAIKLLTSKIYISTAPTLYSRSITAELGIVSAECVYGAGPLKDIASGLRNVFGGRADGVQNLLRDAKNTVLLELAKEAVAINADAIISTAIKYDLVGDPGNMMAMAYATGTAVQCASGQN